MTLDECRKSTALLGFSESLTELDDLAESSFRAALNRAIWEVDALRPRTGVLTLSHNPPVNHVRRTDFYHIAGTQDTICAMGDAYSFRVYGNGKCVVSNGYREVTHTFCRGETPTYISGYLSGVLELTFSGDSNYAVKDVGVWDKGDCIDGRVPVASPYVTYNISELAPDALGIISVPERLLGGKLVPLWDGYRLSNRRYLELPWGERGDYRITYRRLPPTIAQDTDFESELALDEDLCQLLPLQIAYYLLLDDDPAAAKEYLTQFREGAYRIGAMERVRGVALCESVNGW